ncbi:hypothetical protein QCE48_17460 [Caballeronia sp. LZ024]|nr:MULTISPECIES: hypothetical protein [unclassified Caballeronia]MDR5752553.1 hypothetical protein [Caballeronia sp. LZ024]MDR5841709.1 hypothetical protein [Caballeronia sp. LZ031]
MTVFVIIIGMRTIYTWYLRFGGVNDAGSRCNSDASACYVQAFDQHKATSKLKVIVGLFNERHLAGLMVERGLSPVHTTIMRWVKRYTPEYVKRWNWLPIQKGAQFWKASA